MLDIKYIRQLCKEILEINIEDIYILELPNEVKNPSIKQYTVYVNGKIKNKYIDITIENIYPLTHSIEDTVYKYDNLSEEEIKLLTEILKLLDINVSLLSNEEYIQIKGRTVDSYISLNLKLSELEDEIKVFKESNKQELAYNKCLIYKSLISDMENLQLIPSK